jgi:hypothetical protein
MDILKIPLVDTILDWISIFTGFIIIGAILQLIIYSIFYLVKKEKPALKPLQRVIKNFKSIDNENDEFKLFSKLGMVLFSIGIIWGTIEIIKYTPYGSKQVGSIVEKYEYTTEYYVNLFPEDAKAKNYRVKAEIRAESGLYYLECVTMPNGGKIYFDPFDSLVLNEKVKQFDVNDRLWYVELINKKVDED